MPRILIVEDEPALLASLSEYLRREGFEPIGATSLVAARELFARAELIVLDWMLPDGQGVDLLRDLRARGVTTPIILLTAKNELVDKVLGLELGANDYLTKPFEPRELLARIRVQLRAPSPLTPRLTIAGVDLDPITREVRFENRKIELTKKEFELLKLLAENPNRVFTRNELLNQVWGFESYPNTRTVDTHVLQLRQKLTAELVETVRGVGYRLKADQGLAQR